MIGKVKWFSERKGYGFIAGDEGTDVFVHFNEIKGDGFKTLREGQEVQFNMKNTERGFCATEVEII